jgi:TfoX/Sxy family transcriptional regulator of competence genes
MKMEKSPPELIEKFDRVFPADPRAQRRPMFGFAAAFVNGNHFGGLFERHIVLRLGEADRQLLQDQHGATPFAPMGHPMSGYVTVPDALVADEEQLRHWLGRALEHGAAMPPKTAKPKKTTPKSRR